MDGADAGWLAAPALRRQEKFVREGRLGFGRCADAYLEALVCAQMARPATGICSSAQTHQSQSSLLLGPRILGGIFYSACGLRLAAGVRRVV
jgi:hypothetical protein